MRETAADLERLNAVLDASVEKASPFLRRWRRSTRSSSAAASTCRPSPRRHLARRPGVSVTYYEERSLAVIVHGQAGTVAPGEDPFEEIEEIRLAAGGESLLEWSGDPIFLRVEPDVIYTYAKEL